MRIFARSGIRASADEMSPQPFPVHSLVPVKTNAILTYLRIVRLKYRKEIKVGVKIMKVLLVNGSPNEKGCTNRALEETAKALNEEGIESEIFWIGSKPIAGCIGCNKCAGSGRCVLGGIVNDFSAAAGDADGFIFGSPVYYAAATGAITSFLDRVFFSRKPDTFRLKPGASIVSARRAGTTAAIDQLNKYFTVAEMPVISSRYWNMVHGKSPEEVEKDVERSEERRVGKECRSRWSPYH